MNNLRAQLIANPDNISALQELKKLSGNAWFLDLNSDEIIDLLGIEDCYSKGVDVFNRLISSSASSYCNSITLPNFPKFIPLINISGKKYFNYFIF